LDCATFPDPDVLFFCALFFGFAAAALIFFAAFTIPVFISSFANPVYCIFCVGDDTKVTATLSILKG